MDWAHGIPIGLATGVSARPNSIWDFLNKIPTGGRKEIVNKTLALVLGNLISSPISNLSITKCNIGACKSISGGLGRNVTDRAAKVTRK